MKYKVGDRVRIMDERTAGMEPFGGMDHWLGKVMTIQYINTGDCYKMMEDSAENGGGGWFWRDNMISGLAEEPEKLTVCPKCGNVQIKWDYRFCPICGNPVKENAPAGAAAPDVGTQLNNHLQDTADEGICQGADTLKRMAALNDICTDLYDNAGLIDIRSGLGIHLTLAAFLQFFSKYEVSKQKSKDYPYIISASAFGKNFFAIFDERVAERYNLV